jgi:serine/threonine protein kinase
MASQGYHEELLQRWFPYSKERSEPTTFPEKDIRDISAILGRAGKLEWSRIPRLYIVLRLIDKLDTLEAFVQQGISDTWFPFDQRSLPECLHGLQNRAEFLEAQRLVCNTRALNLERADAGHGHFPDPSDIPLKKVGDLGKGASGFVERVVSTISHRESALKRIRRGTTFRKDKTVLQDFENELSTLKRLSQEHLHIIELIASFTEPKFVGLLFPVADCNLAELMANPSISDQRWSLRTYFGCLASALGFLHDNKIRHKDIKPQNILIKDHAPFFTDFGISIDWTEYGQSTTVGPTAMTPRYCAPKVAAYEPRNSSSDVWSLGCVFLEMFAVLKGATVKELAAHFTFGVQIQPYHFSDDVNSSWINHVLGLPGPDSDNLPAEWIKQMLKTGGNERWSAHLIAGSIRECSAESSTQYFYIGQCCLGDDDATESVLSYIEPLVGSHIGQASYITGLAPTDACVEPWTLDDPAPAYSAAYASPRTDNFPDGLDLLSAQLDTAAQDLTLNSGMKTSSHAKPLGDLKEGIEGEEAPTIMPTTTGESESTRSYTYGAIFDEVRSY